MTLAGVGILIGVPAAVLVVVLWWQGRKPVSDYDRRMDKLDQEQRLREGRLP